MTTEGGLYGIELPAYGNQTKKRKEIWSDSYTGVYVLKNLCVKLEVVIPYVRWFSYIKSCAFLKMPFGAGTKLWLACLI